MGLGIAQICGVVLSLSVVSEGRREVLESKQGFTGLPDDASISSASDKSEDEGDDDEIAGALAGAYSFCGGELVDQSKGGSYRGLHQGRF